MKHQWTQAPGDLPPIGFLPRCTRCGINADHPDANKDCDKAPKKEEKAAGPTPEPRPSDTD